MNLSDLRKEYTRHGLRRDELSDDPLEQFRQWFGEALEAGIVEANAMVLSTAGLDGFPSSRVVLLKALEDGKFQFFTNYESLKAQEIAADSKAALNFFWPELERQIRIRGVCHRLPESVSDAYFRERPRLSQLGAWASSQSRIVSSRRALEDRMAALEVEWQGRTVERPGHWGGYGLEPVEIEFWQGREGRLHDRFRYRQLAGGASWAVDRLCP